MKKAMALLLAAIMCTGIFAACGKDEKSGNGEGGTASGDTGFPSLGFGGTDKTDGDGKADSSGKSDGTSDLGEGDQKEEQPSVWASEAMYIDANGQWHLLKGLDGSGTDIPLGVYTRTNFFTSGDVGINADEDRVIYASDGENIYFAGQKADNDNYGVIYSLDKNGEVEALCESQYNYLEQKGDVILFKTQENILYSCIGGKALKLAENVQSDPYISDDGVGVWFANREDRETYSFWYVQADGNSPVKKVAEPEDLSKAVIAYQENVLLYSVEKYDSDSGATFYSIYISRAGKTPELIIENAVSRTFCEYGETFFYYSKQSGKRELYWYDGEKTVLAADIGINKLGESEMKASDQNKQQRIYYADSKSKDGIYTHTYVYKYGDIAGTVNSKAESSYYYSYACGFLNGEEVFIASGGKLVIHDISSMDPDDNKVIDIYDAMYFSEDGKLFYQTEDGSVYLYENRESRLLMSPNSLPNKNRVYSDSTIVLLEAEDEQTETDRITKGTLKQIKTDGTVETVAENCSFFTYTKEGKLLFIAAEVLYCYDGENTVRLADNVLRAYPGSLVIGE